MVWDDVVASANVSRTGGPGVVGVSPSLLQDTDSMRSDAAIHPEVRIDAPHVWIKDKSAGRQMVV